MKRLLNTCLLAASCAAGCSSSDPATEADYDDMAQALTASVSTGNAGGEVGAMYDSTNVAVGNTIGFTVEGTGKFSGTHVGLTYQYEGSCSDASGSELSACGGTTDDASIKVNWNGELALPLLRISGEVTRDGAWQLSNIQSGTVDIAGDSNFSLDLEIQSLFREVTRRYHVGYAAEYTNIKLVRGVIPRIETGTVNYSIDADRMVSGTRRDSEANFHMDGVLQFVGNGKATLTLDKSFKYTLDTNAGTVIKN